MGEDKVYKHLKTVNAERTNL